MDDELQVLLDGKVPYPRLGSVHFDSIAGSMVELLIFFAAQSSFTEDETKSNFYYFIKWVLEELLLFASWEFWERPAFRTIMLRQLTVRNILFQLRYLPSFEDWSLRKVYLLQPVVVLTLAVVHIVTERVLVFVRAPTIEVRNLVSDLFFQLGVHVYLALLFCELLTWRSRHDDDLLWLRTCIITLVYQSGVLMFAVVFAMLVFQDTFLIARLFDLAVLTSVLSFARKRIEMKSNLKIDFSLTAAQALFQQFSEMDENETIAFMSESVMSLHPLVEMASFLSCTAFMYTLDGGYLIAASMLFAFAFLLAGVDKRGELTPRLAIYLMEVSSSLSGLAAVEFGSKLSLDSGEALVLAQCGCAVAMFFSCAGLRDLINLALV